MIINWGFVPKFTLTKTGKKSTFFFFFAVLGLELS
jgi:hypothetical protein